MKFDIRKERGTVLNWEKLALFLSIVLITDIHALYSTRRFKQRTTCMSCFDIY